jgi:hypothetical protein
MVPEGRDENEHDIEVVQFSKRYEYYTLYCNKLHCEDRDHEILEYEEWLDEMLRNG